MAIHGQKEEKYGAMGENGETIKIGTVVQHPVARPPCLLFYSVPNEDTRRASRDDAMVNKKKKKMGGGRGNKVPFGTFGNSRGFFSTECWVQRKVHTGLQAVWLPKEVSKMRCVQFWGNDYSERKNEKEENKKLHSALKPSCTTLKVSCNAIVYQNVQITNSTPI